VVDEGGKQLYARYWFGNEVYPQRDTFLFARDETNKEYYARDTEGNEMYPCFSGQTRMISGKLAKYRNGTQRYPADIGGNEYYLSHEGRPYLLVTAAGTPYFAKNRRGYSLIPWNSVVITDDTPYLCTRDAGGTVVYVHETELPESFKTMCKCLCRCASSSMCPALLQMLLR